MCVFVYSLYQSVNDITALCSFFLFWNRVSSNYLCPSLSSAESEWLSLQERGIMRGGIKLAVDGGEVRVIGSLSVTMNSYKFMTRFSLNPP